MEGGEYIDQTTITPVEKLKQTVAWCRTNPDGIGSLRKPDGSKWYTESCQDIKDEACPEYAKACLIPPRKD